MPAIGSSSETALDAVALLRELRTTQYEKGGASKAEIDYQRLAAAIAPMLELSEKPPGLWRRIPCDDFPGQPGILLYHALFSAVSRAAFDAPTPEEKEKWLRLRVDLVLRMMRDGETHRVYAEERLGLRQERGCGPGIPWSLATSYLPGARGELAINGFLKSDDWGLAVGVTWNNTPGTILLRDREIFVDVAALREAGLPLQVHAGQITAANTHWDKTIKKARIPIGSPGGDLKKAFRDKGKVYLPVRELHRQGVFEVSVSLDGQMVWVSPETSYPEESPYVGLQEWEAIRKKAVGTGTGVAAP